MSGLLLFKIVVVAGAVFFFIATVSTIAYRITDTALEVLVLGRVLRRVLLADIEEVHRRGALLHESWSGPKFWNAITLRRRTGLFRNFVITPDQPDLFAERLRQAVARGGSAPPGGAD